jgi:hypothetical protein
LDTVLSGNKTLSSVAEEYEVDAVVTMGTQYSATLMRTEPEHGLVVQEAALPGDELKEVNLHNPLARSFSEFNFTSKSFKWGQYSITENTYLEGYEFQAIRKERAGDTDEYDDSMAITGLCAILGFTLVIAVILKCFNKPKHHLE